MARSISLLAATGATVAWVLGEFRPLAEVMAKRHLIVEPASAHWIDPQSRAPRRVFFLARESAQGLRDLYVAEARTAPDDRVIALNGVYNLTQSPAADECELHLDHSLTYAAIVSRVDGRVDAITVVDTRGDRGELPPELGARVRLAVSRAQRTGRPTGYGLERFDVVRNAQLVHVEFEGTTLLARIENRANVRIDPEHRWALEGHAELLRHRPHVSAQMDAWVPWAVNTVRAVPWIGSEPIELLESFAFGAEHQLARLRSATVGTGSRADDAQDLQDVLSGSNSSANRNQTLEGPVLDWPPQPITPIVLPGLAREGEWSPLVRDGDPFSRANPGTPAPMYISFLRPDPERMDGRTFFAVWDPRQIELHVVPGSEEPIGATGETGTGAIPRDERTMSHLVGGFNGAFQAIHGEFGVYAEGTVLLPAKPYAATVMLQADGNLAFGSWPRRLNQIPDDIVEFRQNMTAIVDEGQYNPWRRGYWGGIHGQTTDTHTTRTAICLTQDNYVIYAWGDHVEPAVFGRSLIAARCRYAVHLDMNGSNTGFDLYRVAPPSQQPPLEHPLVAGFEAEGTISGLPGVNFRVRKLVRRMSHNIPRYVRRDPRDFFYLMLRNVLPGAPTRTVIAPALASEGTWHVNGMGNHPFPWPMARTRLRPDPALPDRVVNLVRVDPRRVNLAPLDTTEPLVARFVGGAVRRGNTGTRLTMVHSTAGFRWFIGPDGDGIAGEPLRAGMSPLRAVGIDADGYLVVAATDRATPDLLQKALDLAGCGATRMTLSDTVLTLPSGQGVLGETVSATQAPVLALALRPWLGAVRRFEEVVPVSPNVWTPPMQHRVRYQHNPDQEGTIRVNVLGGSPLVLPLRGWTPPDAGTP